MPGKLEFSFNSNRLSDIALDKEVMIIGRKADNDIRIDNLAVSGHHAKLLTIFDDSFLEDLNSTNGTYVNGRSISKHPLKNGDIIIIGKHELRYINDNEHDDSDEKTVLIRPPSERHQLNTTAPSLAPYPDNPGSGAVLEQRQIASAKLQILNGRTAGKELLLQKSLVKLGKSGTEFAQIIRRIDGHFIIGTNQQAYPLRVNGEDPGTRAVKLQNHDIIEIKQLKIKYLLPDRE